MKIFTAEKSLYPLIQKFLIPYEENCVSLCAHVRKNEDNIYIAAETCIINSESDIFGILYLDGSLLHCVPQINNDFISAFKNFSSGKKIKAINGEETVSKKLIEALAPERNPYQTNEYILMSLKNLPSPPPETLSCDVEIKRCTEDDMEILLPLQKQYIIKEVAPAGKQVSDLECKISLRQILKNQLIFALYDDGELVAKANTNAIGWNYVQIGGVFTHPLYRRNHYSWSLLKTLCDRIHKNGKYISLYVKTRNTPAIKLYESLGFKSSVKYLIAYF